MIFGDRWQGFEPKLWETQSKRLPKVLTQRLRVWDLKNTKMSSLWPNVIYRMFINCQKFRARKFQIETKITSAVVVPYFYRKVVYVCEKMKCFVQPWYTAYYMLFQCTQVDWFQAADCSTSCTVQPLQLHQNANSWFVKLSK